MDANRLQLNEITRCSSQRRVGHLPVHAVQFCASAAQLATVVGDLGVLLDNVLTLTIEITKTHYWLLHRTSSSAKRSFPRDALVRLDVALALTQLDYCKAVLAGLPAVSSTSCSAVRRTSRLRSAPLRPHHSANAAALGSCSQRIEFNICAMMYHCLHGLTTDYPSRDIERVTDVQPSRRLRRPMHCWCR